MARTKRRDSLDTVPKRPDYIMPFGLGLISKKPTDKETRRAHMDKKKSYKPGRKAKVYLDKGAKAKTRRALDAVVVKPDAAPMPKRVKTHVWDWN